ncbi:hypothetical protein J2X11_001672 [Aeromicrobium panaciterrae]|uniref:site-specific DNA-methyltransferase (adenine-specific) n=1 Tax=Aeromicrobium panaciterrae TaxID=363861 RepID=A0ABU1UNV4_9ACTN|nr:N-6 DNA methylase [Aeromicrobium panaciterrae]MDR7086833.1 hypothetical protein [Aeromicrobium panaciterrae]
MIEVSPPEVIVAKALIKSRQRVSDHGEVFTPDWLVETMLDLVREESQRIDSRFLEPACGEGNFLMKVLERKLAAVQIKYGQSEFEKRHFSLLGLMCIYGIELLPDNLDECRANMLAIFVDFLKLTEGDDLLIAGAYVLSKNIVLGDALTMLNDKGSAITFAEWGYLGRGKFQRRDFRFDTLTQMSAFGEEDTLFADLGRHEVFTPSKNYTPMTVRELSA